MTADHRQELVERVARAIALSDYPGEALRWPEDFGPGERKDYRDNARAAIAAAQSDGVVEALRRCDELFDNLWDAVPWGQTWGLDIAALNEVPALVKRTLAALPAPEPVEEQKQ